MLLIVLLVEDDPELSDNLTEILQSFGCNVRAYANAAGALSFLEREHADCLLTDLRLPGQDGMAMLEELRRRQVMIPTIVMSGFVEPEHVRRAAELGVLDVQSKPINLQRLQHILERIAS
jgi:DNA-binding NtrC family response regulator